MKIVKETKNGMLQWFDASGFREPTAEELRKKELRDSIPKINRQINEYKTKLYNTDYKQAKWLDGVMSEEEYAPIRTQRQEWRNQINALEEELKQITIQMREC